MPKSKEFITEFQREHAVNYRVRFHGIIREPDGRLERHS